MCARSRRSAAPMQLLVPDNTKTLVIKGYFYDPQGDWAAYAEQHRSASLLGGLP